MKTNTYQTLDDIQYLWTQHQVHINHHPHALCLHESTVQHGKSICMNDFFCSVSYAAYACKRQKQCSAHLIGPIIGQIAYKQLYVHMTFHFKHIQNDVGKGCSAWVYHNNINFKRFFSSITICICTSGILKMAKSHCH